MKAVGQSFSMPAMSWFRLALVLGSLVGGFGCKPKIGEDCATSVDCSISGDRLCDVTLPGGYCTVFNCEPNQCPDEAACVAFREGTCSTASVSTRFRRTFCMRTCEDDSDCRGGSYHCIDISRDESRQVVDTNPSNRRICAIPSSSPPPDPRPEDPAVCFPSDASFDVSRPEAGTPPNDGAADTDTVESSLTDRTPDATDGSDDRRDASARESGSDATDDVVDSSSADAGDDAATDAGDAPEATFDDGASD
jgi:hypothetical protein